MGALISKEFAYPLGFWGGVLTVILGITETDDVGTYFIYFGLALMAIFAFSTYRFYQKYRLGWSDFWANSKPIFYFVGFILFIQLLEPLFS